MKLMIINLLWLLSVGYPAQKFCLPVNMDECTREVEKFGYNKRFPIRNPVRPNMGLNFTLPSGSMVYSIWVGIVKQGKSEGGFGNHLIIHMNDSTEVTYAHLSERKVEKGDSVKCGQLIGLIGSTGLCTAPHLHLRVSVFGEYTDPELYLSLPSISSQKK